MHLEPNPFIRARDHFEQGDASALNFLHSYWRGGKALDEAREDVPFGEWEETLKKAGINPRTARRGIALFSKYASPDDITATTLAEALGTRLSVLDENSRISGKSDTASDLENDASDCRSKKNPGSVVLGPGTVTVEDMYEREREMREEAEARAAKLEKEQAKWAKLNREKAEAERRRDAQAAAKKEAEKKQKKQFEKSVASGVKVAEAMRRRGFQAASKEEKEMSEKDAKIFDIDDIRVSAGISAKAAEAAMQEATGKNITIPTNAELLKICQSARKADYAKYQGSLAKLTEQRDQLRQQLRDMREHIDGGREIEEIQGREQEKNNRLAEINRDLRGKIARMEGEIKFLKTGRSGTQKGL